jgi:Calcineurin-like phosphoesterase
MTTVRVIALGDLHGRLPDPGELPECDIALIAGDVCPLDDHSLLRQRRWLEEEFTRWLKRLPAEHVVGIAGNHDLVFALEGGSMVPHLPWHYLNDSGVELCGLRLYGTPWVPWIGGRWAFQAPAVNGDRLLTERFATVPDELDVLIAHTPPYGVLDRTARGENVGSPELLETIQARPPRLVVCGHIHEAYGLTTVGDAQGMTLVANVAMLDELYRNPHRPVMQFTVPPRPAPVERVS